MFVTKKAISRRTMLRGVGTAVALPLLDAMIPAFAPAARHRSRAPLRRRLSSQRRHLRSNGCRRARAPNSSSLPP